MEIDLYSKNELSVMRLILTLLILLMLAVPVSAWVHPPGYGEICFPCHDLLIPKNEKIKKLSGCRCHSLDIWRGKKIDMDKLDKLHGNNICIKCHIGPEYNESNIGIREIHIPHRNLNCSVCHGAGLVSNPGTKDCHYCHKGGIHEIHGDILMDICEFCHGKVIYKFIKPASKEIGLNVTKVEEVKKTKTFSLFDIIRSILGFLGGLI